LPARHGASVKAALSHMARLLAAELAPGVRVNAIAPGVVETDCLLSVLSNEVRALTWRQPASCRDEPPISQVAVACLRCSFGGVFVRYLSRR
jgi:NAD(P)-dependent dehydrogenase (short-subunit alcohol dehydrogenase family)